MIAALLLTWTTLAGEPARLLSPDSDALDPSTDVNAAVELRDAWVAARVAAGAKGAPEAVRVPVVWRSMGWGCPCPEVFLGLSTNMSTGPWLKVSFAEGVAPPTPPPTGLVVVADGHFTGGTTPLDLQPEGEAIPEFLYTLTDFHVTAWRPWKPGGEDDWLVRVPAGTE